MVGPIGIFFNFLINLQTVFLKILPSIKFIVIFDFLFITIVFIKLRTGDLANENFVSFFSMFFVSFLWKFCIFCETYMEFCLAYMKFHIHMKKIQNIYQKKIQKTGKKRFKILFYNIPSSKFNENNNKTQKKILKLI